MKYALYFAAFAVATTFGAPIWVAAVVGYAGGRLANKLFFSDKADVEPSRTPGGDRKSQAVERDGVVTKKGWVRSALPLDVKLTSMSGDTKSALFEMAGIPDLVCGNRNGLVPEYSFTLSDLDSAFRVEEYLKSHRLPGSISQLPSGKGFIVRSGNIDAINELAKVAYPKVKTSVRRDVVHHRQYIVNGVRSYDEAVALFKKDRNCGHLINTYTEKTNSVNGVAEETLRDGSPATYINLSVGEYIITETELMRSEGTVLVPSRLDADAVKEYVSKNYSSDNPGANNTTNVVLSDGTPENVRRSFIVSGHYVDVLDAENERTFKEHPLKAYAVIDSFEALASVINEGTLKEGTFVSVSEERPVVDDGKYVIELDLSDEKVRRCLQYAGIPVSASVQSDLITKYGISPETFELSMIADSKIAVLKSDIKEDVIDRSKVNGTEVSLLLDRVSVERLPQLSPEGMNQWMKDAAEIKSVSVVVDPVAGEMRIRTEVGDYGQYKTESYMLSAEEREALSKRGSFTQAELKDLVMQLYPGYFKTYRAEGGNEGIFHNPVHSFLKGEKPVTKKEHRAHLTNLARKAKQHTVKKRTGLIK